MASSGRRVPGIRNNLEYSPVNISFLSQQKIEFPELSYWRNNLVAASRCYNYIFLALRTRIHVYQPTYPSQTFPEKPLCILESEPSVSRPGCIDSCYPHAINSLIIGDLGVEEVLVSAHDDGDICVWYTRDLTRIAIQQNVGISAWGVALHKERRLLAVSTNSHLIHVFDLGLKNEERKVKRAKRALSEDGKTRDGGVAAQESQGEPQWNEIILKGHAHNIPNISFLDDPSGNWLVGTSIDGMVIVWDIENQRKVNAVKLGYLEMGWSVLFLQPECFLPTRNELEGLGVEHIMKTEHAYDISPFVSMRGNATYSFGSDDWETGDSDLEEESDDGAETEDYEDDDDILSDDYLDPPHYPQREASEVESSIDHSMDEAGDEDEDSWDENEDMWADSRSDEHNLLPMQPMVSDGDADRVGAIASSGSASSRGTSVTGTQATSEPERNPPSTIPQVDVQLPVPPPQKLPPQSFIFSTSEYHAQLFNIPSLDSVVICEHVLHSPPPPGFDRYISHVDRLNMVCVIPELSMVVAATQKGRAAIFRLTQNEAGFMMRLDEMLPREPTDGIERSRLLEDEPQTRPCAALLGIAVGPIQGREFGRSRRSSEGQNTGGSDSDGLGSNCQDPSEARVRKRRGVWRGLERRRRYRLLMVYIDGTILSYELGGTPDSELSACTVDGGYLMV